MTRTAPLVLALPTAIALLGTGCSCSKKSDAPPPAESATATATVAATPQAATAPGSVGIAECDEYLQKYEECARRSKSGNAVTLKAQRNSFILAASTPEGQRDMKASCRSMLEKLVASKACSGAPASSSAPPKSP